MKENECQLMRGEGPIIEGRMRLQDNEDGEGKENE